MKKRTLKKLLLAAGMTMCLTVIGKVPVWADCLTMTIERFTLGGGFLMEPTVVEFKSGETCADILQRVLKEKGWTYSYDTVSYGFYLQGIDGVDTVCNPPEIVKEIQKDLNVEIKPNDKKGLYEFSYTQQSGWMYTINDVYQSGMQYVSPKDGDVFRLAFSLVGNGADWFGKNESLEPGKVWFEPADKTNLIHLMALAKQAGQSSSPAYQNAIQTMATLNARTDEVNGAIQVLEAASGLSASTKPTVPDITLPAESSPSATPSPTPSPSPSLSPSATETPSATPTEKPSPSPSGTPSATATPTPTAEPTITDEKTKFETGTPTLNASAASDTSIALTWDAYPEADKYIVSRRTMGIPGWTQVAEVTDLTYTDATVKAGASYYYKVKAASQKWGTEVYSKDSKETMVSMSGSQVEAGNTALTKVQSAGYNKLKLTWGKADTADGYEIARSDTQDGEYALVKTITGGDTLTCTDSGLATGQTYYYKVRAYIDGTEKVYGAYSDPMAGTPKLGKASTPQAKGAKRAVQLKWKKVDGATGYTVYRASSKKGPFKKIKTLKKATSFKDKGVKSKKTYYYRICAYRTVNGKAVTGANSAVRKVTVK